MSNELPTPNTDTTTTLTTTTMLILLFPLQILLSTITYFLRHTQKHKHTHTHTRAQLVRQQLLQQLRQVKRKRRVLCDVFYGWQTKFRRRLQQQRRINFVVSKQSIFLLALATHAWRRRVKRCWASSSMARRRGHDMLTAHLVMWQLCSHGKRVRRDRAANVLRRRCWQHHARHFDAWLEITVW